MSISINAGTDSYDVQRRLIADDPAQPGRRTAGGADQPQPDVVSLVQVRDENLHASANGIEDVESAVAAVNAAKQQITEQPGAALAAQANLDPRNVLELLRG